MTVKLGSLRADLKRENDGDWIDIPELPGVRLKVRSLHYGPFQAAKSITDGRLARQYPGNTTVPPDVLHRENGRLYGEHILLGWDGFDEPYSEERASEVLADPEYRELHEHIRYAMRAIALIDAEFIEGAGKNSRRSSGGNSKTATEHPTGSPT